MTLPGLTKRAAEALKPFVDRAMDLERRGLLADSSFPTDVSVSLFFRQSQLRELLAALRESQREAEGITGGV